MKMRRTRRSVSARENTKEKLTRGARRADASGGIVRGTDLSSRIARRGGVAVPVAAAAVAGLANWANATAITWNNTGTDFNANASWVGNLAPGSADNATFTGAEVTNPNLSASSVIQGLTFSTVATSGYTLS